MVGTVNRRVRVVHTRAAEAGPLLDAVRKAGFTAEFTQAMFPEVYRAIRMAPPDVVVIDLSRLPSHGKELAVVLRNSKRFRMIPLVFAGGAPEKVEAIRKLFPDCGFVGVAGIGQAILKAIKAQATATVPPPVPMMDRYGSRTVAQKLGIREGMRVAVFNAPRDYAAVVGELPKDALLEEEPECALPLTLIFVRDTDEYDAVRGKLRRMAAKSKLWVIWRKSDAKDARKGDRLRLTDRIVRETALGCGLVDYKICALGAPWSGMLFAVKKT